MKELIEKMKGYTDLIPWYCISYGDKCYAFAVVEAFQLNEKDPLPKPGTWLNLHAEKPETWVGENGTEMMINTTIASIEEQNGGTICEFIAGCHAHFLGEVIEKQFKDLEL